jgi:hypothetical protein
MAWLGGSPVYGTQGNDEDFLFLHELRDIRLACIDGSMMSPKTKITPITTWQ